MKAFEIERSDPAHQRRRFVSPTAADSDVPGANTTANSRFRDRGPSIRTTGVEGSPAITSQPTTFADTSRTAIADPVAISAYPAQLRAPVTLRSMVTDVFRWIGLGARTINTPVPAVPMPRIVELLWVGLAPRRVHRRERLSDDEACSRHARRLAGGTINTTGALDVTVTGSLNARDADGDKLTYTVVTPPGRGTVVIDRKRHLYVQSQPLVRPRWRRRFVHRARRRHRG